ncbi:response regulator transcription factor [Chloroflexi bacterium TSY]|nr:response regulator transcription factor [Chloroflexi bacterium TSY]
MYTMTTQSFRTSSVEAGILTQRKHARLGQMVKANRHTAPDKPIAICLLLIVEQERLTDIRQDTIPQMLGVACLEIVSAIYDEHRTSRSEASTKQGDTLSELHHQRWTESLSERESEILRLISAGLSNREIAERLVIAVSTVKRHLSNIYGKLGVHSRTQAIKCARQLALL